MIVSIASAFTKSLIELAKSPHTLLTALTPLSTHIQNNQDADLETLGNFVDDLRKVKEGGALSKWNPTIASISFPFLSNKSKAAVKRAQSQTCLNYAEREQSRRKATKATSRFKREKRHACMIFPSARLEDEVNIAI